MFGGNAFGWTYFAGFRPSVGGDQPRVGGTPTGISGGDVVRSIRGMKQPKDEIDYFALGQALGVIDP